MNYLSNLNLNQNELQNAVLQVLSSAPSNPIEGQMYYNSTDKVAYQYKGSAKGWEPIGDLNVIETVKVNGSALAVTNKAVDVSVPLASDSDPEMDGTAYAGTATTWSRSDHVHPVDTSRQAKITASGILKGDGDGGVSAATAGTDYGTYSKPDGGIPKTDLASGVQDSLDAADAALPKAGGTMSGAIAMGSNKITGLADPTNDQDAATKAYVDGLLAANDAMVFKGTLGAQADNPTATALPDTHNAGWTYRVITAGTYAGIACEIGDLVICVKDGTAAANADWTVAQTNIDGAVTGPASSTSGHIPTFNGTSGKVIQDGYGVASSISDDSTSIPTTAAVNSAINGLIKTASGTISTSATNAEVSFSGTLINAYATMGGAVVGLDITPASNKVTFTCAQAPSAAVTCVVVYA